MPPRTVDNLGVDSSTRWAQDQSQLDTSLIKEAPMISTQTEIDVTLPSFASEFDLLFGSIYRTSPWADFFSPPKYHEQKKRLFTFQIAPSLGSEERLDGQMQRIQATSDQENHNKQDQGEEPEDKEKGSLLKLLKELHDLDRFLIDINTRRTQYQRG
jgi:hypothetical protein